MLYLKPVPAQCLLVLNKVFVKCQQAASRASVCEDRMESPSSTDRRRAWIQSSRQWPTLEEMDPQESCLTSQASIADDDVFSDGCCAGKIESWLLGCGLEAGSETTKQLGVGEMLRPNKSFEDDLSLGADAMLINEGKSMPEDRNPPLLSAPCESRLMASTPRQKPSLPSLNLSHSMSSSGLSSLTSKTASSVSEVLQLCSEDAEETLYQLGFGFDVPQVTARIPTRFFTFPSQLQGINFRLFLESQLQRIRDEDPNLSLASRFRQVEVLTAMANAFYSLYSHVSRTPLQKLAPPEFTLCPSPTEKMRRFRSSVRSEPRSPVERLKDTVSKMCLYTGSPRGSDSTSPQPSPKKRSSLPDIAGAVFDNSHAGVSKKLDLGQHTEMVQTVANERQRAMRDSDEACNTCVREQKEQINVGAGGLQPVTSVCPRGLQASQQADACRADVKLTDNGTSTSDIIWTSLSLRLSKQTATGRDRQCVQCHSDLNRGSTQRLFCETAHSKRPDDSISVDKEICDVVGPQIDETAEEICRVDQHSFRHTSSDRGCTPNRSYFSSHNSNIGQSPDEDTGIFTGLMKAQEAQHSGSENVCLGEAGQTLIPYLSPISMQSQCYITVTDWESDVTSFSLNASNSIKTLSASQEHPSQQPFVHGIMQQGRPLQHPNLKHIPTCIQQANSFELEEIHSAGEEEINSRMAFPLSTNQQYKGLVVRGDSIQSDSSGYAEEETSHES